MQKTIVLFSFMLFSIFISLAMEEERINPRTISDIPNFCGQLAKELEEQPIFEGTVYFEKRKCKVLGVDNFDNARMFDLVNHNTKYLLGKEAWNTSYFSERLQQNVQTSDRDWIKHGLILYIDDTVTKCSLNHLMETYGAVVGLLQRGWSHAQPEDYPTVIFKRDPKEWEFFIKQQTLVVEDCLIRFLASKFELSDSTTCGNDWKNDDILHCNYIYLWVKKDMLPRFHEVFQLEIVGTNINK